MNADELLSRALPLTRSDSTLYRSLSTMDGMGKPWDRLQRTAHVNRPVPNLLQQHPVQEPLNLSYAYKNMLQM